jgi:hypothetical protein
MLISSAIMAPSRVNKKGVKTMKKISTLVTAAAIMFGAVSQSSALFVNGGFEDGDFTGWNLDFGIRDYGTTNITWGTPDNNLYDVIDASGTMPGQTLDVNPYSGNYMARINNIYGSYHATKLTQSDFVTQTDLDDGAMIYVNWGAMLIEPSNTHPAGAQPFFGITVRKNGSTVQSFLADAENHNSDPSWVLAGYSGGDLWYKAQTWSYDISSYSVGDILTVEIFVADCGWGGHGAYAFLDGIGTVDPGDPNDVPDASTVSSIAIGLVALGGFFTRRKRGA